MFNVIREDSISAIVKSFESFEEARREWVDTTMNIIKTKWPNELKAAPCAVNANGKINYEKGQTFFFKNTDDYITVRIEEGV